jgi:hypothetical protein
MRVCEYDDAKAGELSRGWTGNSRDVDDAKEASREQQGCASLDRQAPHQQRGTARSISTQSLSRSPLAQITGTRPTGTSPLPRARYLPSGTSRDPSHTHKGAEKDAERREGPASEHAGAACLGSAPLTTSCGCCTRTSPRLAASASLSRAAPAHGAFLHITSSRPPTATSASCPQLRLVRLRARATPSRICLARLEPARGMRHQEHVASRGTPGATGRESERRQGL